MSCKWLQLSCTKSYEISVTNQFRIVNKSNLSILLETIPYVFYYLLSMIDIIINAEKNSIVIDSL